MMVMGASGDPTAYLGMTRGDCSGPPLQSQPHGDQLWKREFCQDPAV